ncbi:L-sorbose 1-dehydrogenase [Colletotrichum chlorophyti]|uniref:L-sorbose 1-dehydrogenase n=1 Tax=Colletotrichum chlorophyti TaxID=708187 RepID=A0A1Q8S1B8_9PEZI|nr:L-sorbose 1-dehydrogenase [Colletotrichum chlorophyti]
MVWPFGRPFPERKAVDVDGKTFDYVIVGGGTSACVLASRLSEDPDVSVLVISKGSVRDRWIDRVPVIGNVSNGKGPQIDTFWSEPHDQWDGCDTRTYNTQAFGGATRINGLMMTRGPPGNYNDWAALGNDQWSFDKCEPYFKKIENVTCHPDAPHRGHEGPLHVTQWPSMFVVDQYIKEAARDVNLPVRDDINDPSAPAMGLFTIDSMIDKFGYRHSAFAAYLPKSTALQREDRLTVCTGVVATKIQTNADGSEATGVYLLDHLDKRPGKECFVRAQREVIVCCGTHLTPQLLMLSGIGPKTQLESHKIPLVRDLSGVGANLQDHVAFEISFETRLVDTYLQMANPLIALWHFILFVLFKTGMFAAAGVQVGAWLNTSTIDEATMTVKHHETSTDVERDYTDASLPENVPDVELLFTNGVSAPEGKKGYCAFHVTLVQPFARGRVGLASSDPLALPKVYHHYITDPRDWAAARKATRFAMNYIERFRKTKYPFNSTWHRAPGVKAGTAEGSWRDVTDEQIDAYIKKRLVNFYHATSTCHMAPEKEDGVVGQDLRVHGFKNLRIGDASVFPKVTSAHTVTPVYMVAERCADFIKHDWANET